MALWPLVARVTIMVVVVNSMMIVVMVMTAVMRMSDVILFGWSMTVEVKHAKHEKRQQ